MGPRLAPSSSTATSGPALRWLRTCPSSHSYHCPVARGKAASWFRPFVQHSGCRESEAAEPERDRGWYSFCVGARRHKTRDKALGSGKTLAKTCVDNSLQQSIHHFEIIIAPRAHRPKKRRRRITRTMGPKEPSRAPTRRRSNPCRRVRSRLITSTRRRR